MSYQVPYYATLGICLLVKDPEGTILGVPVSVDVIGDGGIGGTIEKLVASLATRDLTPLTEEEYGQWAIGLAAEHQQKKLSVALHEATHQKVLDSTTLDAIIAGHKGRPGGDA